MADKVQLDVYTSLVTFDVACRIYGNPNPDLHENSVRNAFFACWAAANAELAAKIRTERASRDERAKEFRKRKEEVLANERKRTSCMLLALQRYPAKNPQMMQARKVIEGVLKLAQAIYEQDIVRPGMSAEEIDS